MMFDKIDSRLARRVKEAVAQVVAKQLATGIDIISDGEMSKPGFSNYACQRFTGFGDRGQFIAQDMAEVSWRNFSSIVPVNSPRSSGKRRKAAALVDDHRLDGPLMWLGPRPPRPGADRPRITAAREGGRRGRVWPKRGTSHLGKRRKCRQTAYRQVSDVSITRWFIRFTALAEAVLV
jgi:hypothetical protein